MSAHSIAIRIARDTEHYENDRQFRKQFIQQVIGPGKEIYRGYMKNKDRPWLDEVHRVFDNGVIQVVNPTKDHQLKLEEKPTITTKIARPGQIRAVFHLPYYDGISNGKIMTHEVHKEPPEYVMRKAMYHQQQGWNRDENLPTSDMWKAAKAFRENALNKPQTHHNHLSNNYSYIYDPDHHKHPGGGYSKTQSGWSKS